MLELTPSEQRAYDRASNSYAEHTRDCPRCAAYHGPPLEACKEGERRLTNIARFWAMREGA